MGSIQSTVKYDENSMQLDKNTMKIQNLTIDILRLIFSQVYKKDIEIFKCTCKKFREIINVYKIISELDSPYEETLREFTSSYREYLADKYGYLPKNYGLKLINSRLISDENNDEKKNLTLYFETHQDRVIIYESLLRKSLKFIGVIYVLRIFLTGLMTDISIVFDEKNCIVEQLIIDCLPCHHLKSSRFFNKSKYYVGVKLPESIETIEAWNLESFEILTPKKFSQLYSLCLHGISLNMMLQNLFPIFYEAEITITKLKLKNLISPFVKPTKLIFKSEICFKFFDCRFKHPRKFNIYNLPDLIYELDEYYQWFQKQE